jgi:hypothetical protein
MNSEANTQAWTGVWGWLLPATYAVHIAEELWGGEGFVAWLARIAGVGVTAGQFLLWNMVALLLMSVSIVLVMRFKKMRPLLLAYGVSFMLNALSHIIVSIYTLFLLARNAFGSAALDAARRFDRASFRSDAEQPRASGGAVRWRVDALHRCAAHARRRASARLTFKAASLSRCRARRVRRRAWRRRAAIRP